MQLEHNRKVYLYVHNVFVRKIVYFIVRFILTIDAVFLTLYGGMLILSNLFLLVKTIEKVKL